MSSKIAIIDELGIQIERLETIIYLRNLVLDNISNVRGDDSIQKRQEEIFLFDILADELLLELETEIVKKLKKAEEEL